MPVIVEIATCVGKSFLTLVVKRTIVTTVENLLHMSLDITITDLTPFCIHVFEFVSPRSVSHMLPLDNDIHCL